MNLARMAPTGTFAEESESLATGTEAVVELEIIYITSFRPRY